MSGFELKTLGVGIQHINHQATEDIKKPKITLNALKRQENLGFWPEDPLGLCPRSQVIIMIASQLLFLL